MAHASGSSRGNVIAGEFTHKISGVHYKIFEEEGRVWLTFDRAGADEIHGKRELLFYIGSGRRGRTYVMEEEGFYFESPVNWYGQKRMWDMTPAYQVARHIPLNLPLTSECLSCHTNDFLTPVPGTDNKYATPIMTQEGIGCGRCHGQGEAHANGAGEILNPAKLSAAKRDAICMQCHLEGSVAIRQPGKHLSEFRPGNDLQDYVHYFVLLGTGGGLTALSQFEAFFQSQCKRKSGDAMTCTSCHDPHFTPSTAQKTAYYRAKCIACHGKTFAEKHQPKKLDCVGCHMLQVPNTNIAHTQATDHRILRNPANNRSVANAEAAPQLQRFPPQSEPPTDRDLALAWQSLAEGGMQAIPQAEKYLRRALQELPDDASLLTAVGYLKQREGDEQDAKMLYEHALKANPTATEAAADLGVIAAQEGDLGRATTLWSQAFARQPGRSTIGINLAKVLCEEGKADEAREVMSRVLLFNPDIPREDLVLRGFPGDAAKCDLR